MAVGSVRVILERHANPPHHPPEPHKLLLSFARAGLLELTIPELTTSFSSSPMEATSPSSYACWRGPPPLTGAVPALGKVSVSLYCVELGEFLPYFPPTRA